AQEQQARRLRAAEHLGAHAPERLEQTRRPVPGQLGLHAVALGVRRQPLQVLVALAGEGVAEVVEIVLDRMPLADHAELVGDRGLGLLHVGDRLPELHGRPSTVSRSPPPPAVRGTSPPSTGSAAAVVGAGATPVPSATLLTETAAVLNSGCLETGSQALIVSSLAARLVPSGSAASPASQ